MAGAVAAEHTIKRAWRFACNRRVEVACAMAGVIGELTRRRKERLVVGLDWTDVRSFHTLTAAACIGGRSAPLLWASYNEPKLRRSQNALDEELLGELKALLPASFDVVILADRGFGRVEWATACRGPVTVSIRASLIPAPVHERRADHRRCAFYRMLHPRGSRARTHPRPRRTRGPKRGGRRHLAVGRLHCRQWGFDRSPLGLWMSLEESLA